MAKIPVNPVCNVVTGEDSNGYISPGWRPGTPARPQITIPAHRLRLSINEAWEMSIHLQEAVEVAKREEDKWLAERERKD